MSGWTFRIDYVSAGLFLPCVLRNARKDLVDVLVIGCRTYGEGTRLMYL